MCCDNAFRLVLYKTLVKYKNDILYKILRVPHLANQEKPEEFVSIAEARRELAELLARVHYGKEHITITRHGTATASIVPIEDVRLLEELQGVIEETELTSDQGIDFDGTNLVSRIEQNRLPVLLVSQMLLAQIEELREKIRGDNQLSSEDRSSAMEALDKLNKLVLEAYEMSEASPSALAEEKNVHTWPKRFKAAFDENMRKTLDAENLANAAVPTGLILGCGALGALIGGPVGFGAGSVLGHLITGQIKPGAAAKKIEEAMSSADTGTTKTD